MNGMSSTRSSRAQLLLIMAIALVTVGGAYLLFYLVRDSGPWGTTNKGAFVDPPMTVAALDLSSNDGAAFETGGTWWLWVVPRGPCAAECREALHQLRQLHVLLNRDAHRVRRGLVTEAGGFDAGLLADYPKLEALTGDVSALSRGVYVVDPIGNLVFHYPLEDAGEPVLDDLKRLLQVSRIG